MHERSIVAHATRFEAHGSVEAKTPAADCAERQLLQFREVGHPKHSKPSLQEAAAVQASCSSETEANDSANEVAAHVQTGRAQCA